MPKVHEGMPKALDFAAEGAYCSRVVGPSCLKTAKRLRKDCEKRLKMGRKYFVLSETYEHWLALSEAGCQWDADKQSWWTFDEKVYKKCCKIVGTPAESKKKGV